ncbi:LacI family DNA-binding transcriptional regulator [Angustibacter aerolatus]
MREVAAHAGVSLKTVSRVVNDDRYVSDELRERVRRAVVELQYVPNTVAVTFRRGRDAAIGVAVPSVGDPFFAAVVEAVEGEARRRGYAVIVTSLGNLPDDERPAILALLQRQVVGLIATPTDPDQSYLRSWQPRTAMVFIDRLPGQIRADTVRQDDEAGGYQATAHLLEHGHRRVAFLGDDDGFRTTALRLDGYRRALREAGVDDDPALVRLGDIGVDALTAEVDALLGADDPPSAVFSSNARATRSFLHALHRLDRHPAYVGFGDFPMADLLSPSVTVVDQDPEAMGRIAVERLFDRLTDPDRRLRRTVLLPVQLIGRGSCGPGCSLR